MPAFLYRCPSTRQNVQGYMAEDADENTQHALTRMMTEAYIRPGAASFVAGLRGCRSIYFRTLPLGTCPLHTRKRTRRCDFDVRFVPIVLQKSKVAGLRIFRENTKQEAITDSYDLNRVTEVACEFSAER